MHLKKHRLGDEGQGGADGWIEALQVSGLGDAAVFRGQMQQFIGLGESRGQWLFDQHVDAGFHQGASDLEMKHGGHGDRRRLHLAVGGEHLLQRAERLAAELAGDGIGAGRIGIDYSHQAHAVRLLQLAINAGVIASERARADDRDIDGEFAAQMLAPVR